MSERVLLKGDNLHFKWYKDLYYDACPECSGEILIFYMSGGPRYKDGEAFHGLFKHKTELVDCKLYKIGISDGEVMRTELLMEEW